MIPSVSKAINDINDLARRSAAERETTAKREIANAEKFWSVWDADVKAAKLGAFARRAKEIMTISAELKAGDTLIGRIDASTRMLTFTDGSFVSLDIGL